MIKTDKPVWVEAREMSVCLEGGGLTMHGQRYVPDATKGYIEFFLAHGLPVVSQRNFALHVGTVANSFQSMRHQGFNLEHRVKSYVKDPEQRRNAKDRYIGSVLDVEFPPAPYGGWKMGELLSGKQAVPGIRGIANVFKQADGVDRLLGEHQSGRHEWTVSLEVDYSIRNSSVALLPLSGMESGKLSKKVLEAAQESTPEDWQALNVWNVAVPDLPDELVECWSEEKESFEQMYQGRRCVLVGGGLNGQVHFKGTGVVRYGAEPTAAMGEVLASGFGVGVTTAAEKVEAALGRLL